MAAMNTMYTSKQKASAELIASYGAEQRRLKAAAAGRRVAAARQETVARDRRATPESSPRTSRPRGYLS